MAFPVWVSGETKYLYTCILEIWKSKHLQDSTHFVFDLTLVNIFGFPLCILNSDPFRSEVQQSQHRDTTFRYSREHKCLTQGEVGFNKIFMFESSFDIPCTLGTP